MEIGFQCTEADYKNFYKYYHSNKLKKNIVSVILIPSLAGYVFAGVPFQFSKFIYVAIISLLIFIGIFHFIPYLISLHRLRKLIIKEPKLIGKKKIMVTESGLYVETTTRNEDLTWESIVSCDDSTDFISLSLADEKVYLIPKRAFLSYTDHINFVGIIQSNLNKTRETGNSLPADPYRKPPYLLGLFCLVPFAGAFVGLVFIFLGATRFKDKWFTLIGVFGVAFSVIVYSTLFYTGKYVFKFDDGFKELSKMQISNLVKDIEFYKIQHGLYPDSLKQLQLDDKSVFIYDPIQANQGRKSNLFYYLRVADKYQLFSSGEDGIPDTEDDLYPQISANMISKIGLIKYELKVDTTQQKGRESTNR